MGIGDSGILAVGTSVEETTKEMLAHLVTEDSELISLYYGEEVSEEEADRFTEELEEIYPCASGKSKEDEDYRNEALEATHLLQQGKPGYMALWNHIMQVSVTDLKRNYDNLNVSFDLWKKESDAQPYIPDMVQAMRSGICL